MSCCSKLADSLSARVRRKFANFIVPKVELSFGLRMQILTTALLCLSGAVAFSLMAHSPFPRPFIILIGVSGAVHLFFYVFYYRFHPLCYVFLVLFNILLMPVIIHYSGGIMSPFQLIFVAIIFGELAFGLESIASMPLVIIEYCSMVIAEYFNIIPQSAISALDIYRTGVSTVLVVVANIGFILITGFYARQQVRELRQRLKKQFAENEKYREHIIKMDRMYQLGYLTARVAHDIRSPITVIKGALQSLQMEYKDGSENYIVIENAVGEVRRMEKLIGNLSGFVRPGHGNKIMFSLTEVVNMVIAVSQMGSLNKEIKFIKGYANTPIMAFGCPEEIQQVFFNLIKNAIEAIEDGPSERGFVMIDLEPAGGQVKVTAADNGCGIAQEMIAEIMQDFRSTKKAGLGLGMGIVSDILASHRTKLDITSRIGKGTSVSFYLPASAFQIDIGH